MTATRTWRWKPHKSITIEITSEPGHGPHIDVCDQGHESVERLGRIIAELQEARAVAEQLVAEHSTREA